MDWWSAKHAVFARHSNPWSAWTRWASTPLLLVPVWRRSRRDAALVGIWMAVNPVMFGRPAHDRAWATRAVLGEELWIAERPVDSAMAVEAAATAAGARRADRRSPAPCAAGRGRHGPGDGTADGVLGADGALLRPRRAQHPQSG